MSYVSFLTRKQRMIEKQLDVDDFAEDEVEEESEDDSNSSGDS